MVVHLSPTCIDCNGTAGSVPLPVEPSLSEGGRGH